MLGIWARRLFSLFVVLLWGLWGVVPLGVLSILVFNPKFLLDHPLVWSFASIGWTAISLLLFSLMLWEDGTLPPSRAHRLQEMAGLVCTFAIGIPAIFVSLLPLFGSPSRFMYALIQDGCQRDLPAPAKSAQAEPGKTLFIVGIDISTSFLKGPEDGKVAMVQRALRAILKRDREGGDDDYLASSMNPDDIVRYYVFASDSMALYTLSNEGTIGGLENKLTDNLNKLPGKLKTYLKADEYRDPDPEADIRIDRTSTDIPGFLNERVCADLRNEWRRFATIKVILFSDLKSSADGDSPGENNIPRLKNVEECVRRYKNASILAFSAAPAEDGKDRTNVNVGHYLESNLQASQWQKIDLAHFDEAKSYEKPLLYSLLFTETVPVDTLYMKHEEGPQYQAIPSSLALPVNEESDKIIVGLRPLAGGACDLRMRIMVGRTGDSILGYHALDNDQDRLDESTTVLERAASEQNPLQVELASPNRITQDQCELLVAVPEQSVLYRIPIVVLTVMEERARTIFLTMLVILHTFPLILTGFVYRSRYREWKAGRETPQPPAPDAAAGPQ